MDRRISKSFKIIFSSLYPNFDDAERENAEEYFFFILKNYPDKSEINQLKLFFITFSFGIRKLFIKDKNIPSFVNNLQNSSLMLLRQLGTSISTLFGICNARSLTGEGNLYKHFEYPIHKNNNIEKKTNEFPESIEVAVVGSGSGGGIAANLLNKKYEVGIFDKGSYLNKERNNETFGYHNFYEGYGMQQTRKFSVLLLAGKSVGGGTSINWTNSLKTPENILKEWDSLTNQDNYFNSDEFKNSMDYVCKQLNVSEKNNKIPHKEVKLIEGLEKNDIGYKIIPRNLSNLDYLDDGFSTFGSSYESRNSSYTSWFSEDTFDQNNIYSDTNIKRLVISNNRATHIEVENGSNSKKIAVNKVILSAGALNTPKILMDSGYSNKQLGKNLKLHPVSGVAGKYSEEQKPWDGSMQGFYSDKFLFKNDNYGYLLEGLPMHPSLFFPFFPNNSDSYESFIKDYNYWSGGIVLTSDTSSGSIVNKSPQHLWKYDFNKFDHDHLIDGLVNLVKAYHVSGASEIMVASSPTLHWKEDSKESIEDFISKVNSIKHQPFRILLGSAHQMGSARMNPDPSKGVVGLDGKVHGLENVYITDSSVFPRCSGVNPMISIQSMSHFLTSKI